MQYSTSLALVSAFFAAILSAAPAQAADNRIQVKFTGGSGTTFCKSWKCDCINYEPTNTALYFEAAYCEPGNYSGDNKNTEALVFCEYTNGNTTTAVNKHIAKETGATIY